MLRRLFTFASALSLLLCAAMLALWVRSQFRLDWIDCFWTRSPADHRLLQIGSNKGKLFIEFKRGVDNPLWPERSLSIRGARAYAFEDDIADFVNPQHVTGIWYAHEVLPDSYHHYWVYVPHLVFSLTMLLLPLVWVRRWWQHVRRRRRGCCAMCGYDLRASIERCPECGTPVPSEVRA